MTKADLLTLVAILAVALLAVGLIAACKLTNPVPVDPDYPPLSARDAGADR